MGNNNLAALYKTASGILRSVHHAEQSIKGACFSSKYPNKKLLYKVVLETCKEWFILMAAIENSKLTKSGAKFYLLLVLVREFANGEQKATLGLLDEFDANKSRLRSEYVMAKLRIPKLSVPEEAVKHARMNTLKSTIEDMHSELEAAGYTRVQGNPQKEGEYRVDEHMAFLFGFHPSQDLTRLEAYTRGALVIQDKASCIPVHVLDAPAGCFALDACAAPGNKTTQLASSVFSNDNTKKQGGRLIAYEKDPKRFKTLEKMTQLCGANIEICNQDFLSVKPFSGPEYFVVDPSCSGSGMRLSLEKQLQQENSKSEGERLESLSNFQCKILQHAMSFPDAKKVVYSTCSIHEEENECVVAQVLGNNRNWALTPRPFSEWKRRGLAKYKFHQDVIRSDPAEDDSIGFFVACFNKVS